MKFYGKPDGRANIITAPYEPAAEPPDDEYDLWLCTGRVLEHWHSGSMTQRVPELHRAAPDAVLYMHPGRRQEAQAAQRREGQGHDPARRSWCHARRDPRAETSRPRDSVFIAWFDAKPGWSTS